MTGVAVPRRMEDLTNSWLSEVLGTEVVEVSAERIGLGVGIMGESWRLTMRYGRSGQGPATVVVKLASPYPENRTAAVDLGLYEAETRFYRELAADTRARTPRCYLSAKDPNTPDFVLVMEDLSDLRMVDQTDGLSHEEATRSVVALAELHGSWWGRVESPEYEWIPSLVHRRIEVMAQRWPELWPLYLDRYGSWLPEGGESMGEMVSEQYWPLMQRLAEGPWTLLHMDFRCENLLFDDTSSPPSLVVLDRQSLGRGSGAFDLSYLLGGSLSVENRRRHEQALVRLYHETLVEMGIAGYGLEQLWEDYRVAHLVTGTSTTIFTGAVTDLGNERGVRLLQAMTLRHFAAAVDLSGPVQPPKATRYG